MDAELQESQRRVYGAGFGAALTIARAIALTATL